MNTTAPAIARVPQPPLLSWISDTNLALAAPVIIYWAVSGFYTLLDEYELAEKYRVHTPQEVETRNRCTKTEVIRAVLLQQFAQTVLGYIVDHLDEPYQTGHEEHEVWKIAQNLGLPVQYAGILYWYLFPLLRFFFAFFVMDTWQYFLHRAMHLNKWLYRNFHSVHHRLYCPYSYGALYNSFVEGILLDTVGAFISSFAAGLTPRENIILYTFSTLKTVDDHCGYEFPWDPLQLIFPNRATYHDIHHQQFGIKTNFSQPFFVHWDLIFKSKHAKTEQYIEHNKQIREKKYIEKKAQKLAGAQAQAQAQARASSKPKPAVPKPAQIPINVVKTD